MKLDLPQIISVGIFNTDNIYNDLDITKNRKTTMFEIEIPVGKGGVSYIDSDRMPIDTDMIICAKPGQIRHTKLPFVCYYIHIILPDGELKDKLSEIPNYIKTDKYTKYLNLFKKMLKYYDTALEKDELIVHSIIFELIHLLIEDSEKLVFRQKSKNNNHMVIEKVIGYIRENLTSELTLESVSKVAGFSPVYFHNCFKASTGLTLRAYIEEQRIRKAAALLVSTNDTLTEIAYKCGFSSQSYFSYAFKRKMNITPREYVRKALMQYEHNHVSNR